MGRIRGRGYHKRHTEDYVRRDIAQEQFDKNIGNLGKLITIGTSLYTNPMIRDAAGGIEDLFQGSPEEQTATAREAGIAEATTRAAAAKLDQAKFDKTKLEAEAAKARGVSVSEERKADLEVLPTPRTAEELATTQEEAEIARSAATIEGQVPATLEAEARITDQEEQLRESESIAYGTRIRLKQKKADRDEMIRNIYAEEDKNLTREREGNPLMEREQLGSDSYIRTETKAVEVLQRQIDAEEEELASVEGKADHLRGTLRQSRLALEGAELKGPALSATADRLAKKAAEMAAAQKRGAGEDPSGIGGDVEAALAGVRGIGSDPEVRFELPAEEVEEEVITPGPMNPQELQAQIRQLQFSPDTKPIWHKAESARRYGDFEEAERLLRTVIGGAVAEPITRVEQAPGATGAGPPVSTGAPSVISDEPLTTSSAAEMNELINKLKTRVATRYVEGSDQINTVIEQIRQQVGVDAFGKTPADIERTIESLAQIVSGQQTTTEVIEVPSIAGKSLQEAQMIAMQIGQNPTASFKSKQEAMRKLLQQVKYIEDVTSDWSAKGGTAGYVGTSDAANRLLSAFSGSIPKAPKAASEYQRFEMGRKATELPGKLEKTRLGNLKTAEQITTMIAEGPVDLDNKLLKNLFQVLKLKQLGTGTGAGGPSGKDLEEFREEILAGSNGSYTWLARSSNTLTNQANKLNQLTVEVFDRITDGEEIIRAYGADLRTYLKDIRNAETAAAKTRLLNKAKKEAKKAMEKRASDHKKAAIKLSKMTAKLRELGISEETRVERERLLRELNTLLNKIQESL